MRTITLEEHYATLGFLDGPGKKLKEQASRFGGRAAKLFEQLCDLGEKRIAEMDAAGIDIQVLSLTSPGTEQLDAAAAVAVAREANDRVAEAVRANPARFAGFAALPTADPQAAVAELERTVHEHGFKGVAINGHVQGRYLDDNFFWPILERAEKLNVPIYLHPTPPPKAVIEASYRGFSPMVSDLLAGPGWGWHIETAVHVIRLILGGVFDKFPQLQIVIGHMGEGLPYSLWRIDNRNAWVKAPKGYPAQKTFREYFQANFHLTTSGNFRTQTLIDAILEIGADRILFSTDWPFENVDHAATWFDTTSISEADRAKIGRDNAAKLFKLDL